MEGIVRLVGVDAFPQVVLARDDSSPAVTLDGPMSLRRVAGLMVAVVGARVGTRFTVTRFVVTGANGAKAVDGILAMEADSLTLVLGDGKRIRVLGGPPALRAAIGHRVWISGPLDRAPVAYGIIE
jgi:hypothetical protein